MEDIAIIGIGMKPFGRHEGISGQEQGAFALRAALADAGVSWDQIGVAYGEARMLAMRMHYRITWA